MALGHVLLHTAGVEGWVDLASNWPFLSQFLQVDVVRNGYVVRRTLEDLVFTSEIRPLQTKSILDFMDLVHLLSILEEEGSS